MDERFYYFSNMNVTSKDYVVDYAIAHEAIRVNFEFMNWSVKARPRAAAQILYFV